MNPKIYKGQQVQMTDIMGNIRFTEVFEIYDHNDGENISAYLTNGMTLNVNKYDAIYSIHGTIFRFM